MHEPVARTPYEKAASLSFDHLYRRYAQLGTAIANPAAVELEACTTYPKTKPAHKEEGEGEGEGEVMGSLSVSPGPSRGNTMSGDRCRRGDMPREYEYIAME